MVNYHLRIIYQDELEIDKLYFCLEVELNITIYVRYNEIIGEYIYLIKKGNPLINEIHCIAADDIYKKRITKYLHHLLLLMLKIKY